jgi:hypothetical protein
VWILVDKGSEHPLSEQAFYSVVKVLGSSAIRENTKENLLRIVNILKIVG